MLLLNNTRIIVSKDKISFRVETKGGYPAPFQRDKLTQEFSIARIFHRVLNAYNQTHIRIFEGADFEILGSTLHKILFEDSENNKDLIALFKTFRNAFQDKDYRCRIYLEFDPDAGMVAMLPWEYLRLNLTIQDKGIYHIYAAADEDAKFDLIRSFPGNENFKPPAAVKKLQVVLVKANCNGPFNIDSDRIMDKWCGDLKKNNQKIDFHRLDQPSGKDGEQGFIGQLKKIIDTFNEPYILHYFGHGKIENSIGYISFVGENGDAEWIEDQTFAGFFESKELREKPLLILLQACSSGQIPRYSSADDELKEKYSQMRGVALNLCLKEIPAVVSMQNDITEEDALAFFGEFYLSLLKGCDIAEAVTRGRTFLGCSYKKTAGSGKTGAQLPYSNNTFGTPVLFISTGQPFAFFNAAGKNEVQQETIFKLCPNCNKVLENYAGDKHSEGCGRPVYPITEAHARDILESQEKKATQQTSASLISAPGAAENFKNDAAKSSDDIKESFVLERNKETDTRHD